MYADKWTKFLVDQTREWKGHFLYWHTFTSAKPYLLVRYEDLLADPETHLRIILEWAFPEESPFRARALSRVPCAVRSALGSGPMREGYRPRERVSAQKLMTKELVYYVHKATQPVACQLGYSSFAGESLPCPKNTKTLVSL